MAARELPDVTAGVRTCGRNLQSSRVCPGPARSWARAAGAGGRWGGHVGPFKAISAHLQQLLGWGTVSVVREIIFFYFLSKQISVIAILTWQRLFWLAVTWQVCKCIFRFLEVNDFVVCASPCTSLLWPYPDIRETCAPESQPKPDPAFQNLQEKSLSPLFFLSAWLRPYHSGVVINSAVPGSGRLGSRLRWASFQTLSKLLIIGGFMVHAFLQTYNNVVTNTLWRLFEFQLLLAGCPKTCFPFYRGRVVMKTFLLGLAVMLWWVQHTVLAALNFFSCKAQTSFFSEHLNFHSSIKHQSFCSSFAFLEHYLLSFPCI